MASSIPADNSDSANEGDPLGFPSSSCVVVLCTYNEMGTLPELLQRIWEHLPEIEVLVVDDNSPDGTGGWVRDQADHNPRLSLLARSGKLGLGSATIAGLQQAIDQGYQYAICMDADLSHDPAALPALLAGMNHPDGQARVDVMIGSRYVPGGSIHGWPLKRHIMSRGVNFLSRWLLGLRPRDCSGSYRCYRTQMLRQLDWSEFWSRGYSFFEEVLWRLKRLGATFDERPIQFVERPAGLSKIDLREILVALRVLFGLGWANYFTRSPGPPEAHQARDPRSHQAENADSG